MPVTPSASVELLRLRERVLARGRRRAPAAPRAGAGDRPPDARAAPWCSSRIRLLLRVQAAGGVDEQHVGPRACGRLQASKTTAPGSAPRCRCTISHADALAPRLRAARPRPRGTCRPRRARPSCPRRCSASGELGDRGGLARAVDADHEDHERALRFVDHQRPAHRTDDVEQRLAQRAEQGLEVGEFLARDSAAQRAEDLLRGLDSDVGADRRRSRVRRARPRRSCRPAAGWRGRR